MKAAGSKLYKVSLAKEPYICGLRMIYDAPLAQWKCGGPITCNDPPIGFTSSVNTICGHCTLQYLNSEHTNFLRELSSS